MIIEFVGELETNETETQLAADQVEPQLVLLTETEMAYVGGGTLVNGY